MERLGGMDRRSHNNDPSFAGKGDLLSGAKAIGIRTERESEGMVVVWLLTFLAYHNLHEASISARLIPFFLPYHFSSW